MNQIKDPPASNSKLVNFEVGQRASLTHVISTADVAAFISLSGDDNLLHRDSDFAKASGFKGPVVHGLLSGAYVSTLIGTLLPGPGALWSSVNFDFVAPSYVGDTLTVSGVVRTISISANALILDILITKQDGSVVIRGSAQVGLVNRQVQQTTIPSTNKALLPAAEPKDQCQRPLVLVTGGSGGVGRSICRRLVASGMSVAFTYHHNNEAAQVLAQELNESGDFCFPVRCDLSDFGTLSDTINTLIGARGDISHVVHCAAPLPRPQPFVGQKWEEFAAHWDVQVRSAWEISQCVLPGMLQQHCGTFTFIGSIYADGAPPTQQSPYVVAKASMQALARSLAVELGPKGIRANVVSPGMTQTAMIEGLPEKVKLLAKMQTPLRSLAEPEDVAGAVEFLMSPSAKHITGETIRVCGGLTMV